MVLDDVQPVINETVESVERAEARRRSALSLLDDVQEIPEPPARDEVRRLVEAWAVHAQQIVPERLIASAQAVAAGVGDMLEILEHRPFATLDPAVLQALWPREVLTDLIMPTPPIPVNTLDGFGQNFFQGATLPAEMDVLPGMDQTQPRGQSAQSEAGRLVSIKGKQTMQSNMIAVSRQEYLASINEQRGDLSTYKRYLLLVASGSEIFDIQNGIRTSLIRRSLPDWVLTEIHAGRSVDVYVYDHGYSPYCFKCGRSSTKILKFYKLPRNMSNERNPEKQMIFFRNSIYAKFKITGVVTAVADNKGIYSDNMDSISLANNISIDKLANFGKMKTIYSMNVSDLTIMRRDLPRSIMLTKFEVIPVEGQKNEFILNILDLKLQHWGMFNSMGTIWI